MEILRGSSGGRAWPTHGRPISTSSKCQGKWRSMAVPRMGPPKAIRMAAAQAQPGGNVNSSGNEKEKKKEVDVLEMISSGVETKPWWAPLFSFSNPPPTRTSASSPSNGSQAVSEAAAGGDGAGKKSKSKSKPKSDVVFTEEKARLLRRQLRAMECWENHGMYRSPVASRLALRFPDQKSS